MASSVPGARVCAAAGGWPGATAAVLRPPATTSITSADRPDFAAARTRSSESSLPTAGFALVLHGEPVGQRLIVVDDRRRIHSGFAGQHAERLRPGLAGSELEHRDQTFTC